MLNSDLHSRFSSRFILSNDSFNNLILQDPIYEIYNYHTEFIWNIFMYCILLYTKNPESSFTILQNLILKSKKESAFELLFLYLLYNFSIKKEIDSDLCYLLLKEIPDISFGYLYLGLMELNKRCINSAIEWIRQAIRVDPFNAKIWYMLYDCYSKIGNKKLKSLCIFTMDYLLNNNNINFLKKRFLLNQNTFDFLLLNECDIKAEIKQFKASEFNIFQINSAENLFLDKFIDGFLNRESENHAEAYEKSNESSNEELEQDISNVLEFLKGLIDGEKIEKEKINIDLDSIDFIKEALESIESYEFYKNLDEKNRDIVIINPELSVNPKLKYVLKKISRFEFIDTLLPQNIGVDKEQESLDDYSRFYEEIFDQFMGFIKVIHWNSLKITNFKMLAFSVLIDSLKMYSENFEFRFFKPLYTHYLNIALFLKDLLEPSEIALVSRKIIEFTNEPLFNLIEILSSIDQEEYTKAMDQLIQLRLKYQHIRFLSLLELYIYMRFSQLEIIKSFFKLHSILKRIQRSSSQINNTTQ